MSRSQMFLAVFTTLVVCGCNREAQREADSLPVTYSLMIQDFTLSDQKQTIQLGQYTVRLISIAEDGATQIKVLQTDKVLTAQPGEYFESYEFGKMGLQLKSATNGVATFFSQGCVTR